MSKDTEDPSVSLQEDLSKLSLDPKIFAPFVEAVLSDSNVSEKEKHDTLCESLSSNCPSATNAEVNTVVESLISHQHTILSRASVSTSRSLPRKSNGLPPPTSPSSIFRSSRSSPSPWGNSSHPHSSSPSLYPGRDRAASPSTSSYFSSPSATASNPTSHLLSPSSSSSLGLSTCSVSSSESFSSSYSLTSSLGGLSPKEGTMTVPPSSMAQVSPPSSSRGTTIPGSALSSSSSPSSGILPALSPGLRPSLAFAPESSLGLGRSTSMNLSFLRPAGGLSEETVTYPPTSMGIRAPGSVGGLRGPPSLSSISSNSLSMSSSPSLTATSSSTTSPTMSISSSTMSSRLVPTAQPFCPAGSISSTTSSQLTPTAEPFNPSRSSSITTTTSSQLTPTAEPFSPASAHSQLIPTTEPFTPSGIPSSPSSSSSPPISPSSQLTPTAEPFTPGASTPAFFPSTSYTRSSSSFSSSASPSMVKDLGLKKPVPTTFKEVLAGWEKGELDMAEFASLMNALESGETPSLPYRKSIPSSEMAGGNGRGSGRGGALDRSSWGGGDEATSSTSSHSPTHPSPYHSTSSYSTPTTITLPSSGIDMGNNPSSSSSSSSTTTSTFTSTSDLDGWTVEEIEEIEEEMEGMQPLTPLGLLCSVFPGIPPDRLSTALSCTGYDIQKALTLLTDTGTSPSSPTSSPHPTSSSSSSSTASSSDPSKLRGDRICRHFMAGACYRRDCWYSHDPTACICKFWLRGVCARPEGECPFLHGVDPSMLPPPPASAGGSWGFGMEDEKSSAGGSSLWRKDGPEELEVGLEDEEAFPALGAPTSKKSSLAPKESSSAPSPIATSDGFARAAKKPPVKGSSLLAGPVHRIGGFPPSSSSSSTLGGGAHPIRKGRVEMPWLDTGASVTEEYRKARGAALEAYRARTRCLTAAAEAYRRGDGAAAKRLSLEAKRYDMAMSGHNEEAAARIFAGRNRGGTGIVDVHGLHVSEGLSVVRSRLQELASEGSHACFVFVGKGNHTDRPGGGRRGGGGRMWEAVVEMCQRHQERRYHLTDCAPDGRGGMLLIEW
ncbi:MAG: hypothetical protein DHS80DRAFT_28854 [Piptocephalis tieghemiana]|nr:MAG: hypothetical protein DHS80DRAFT_28854 [Piptocephalis tieghemiana]